MTFSKSFWLIEFQNCIDNSDHSRKSRRKTNRLAYFDTYKHEGEVTYICIYRQSSGTIALSTGSYWHSTDIASLSKWITVVNIGYNYECDKIMTMSFNYNHHFRMVGLWCSVQCMFSAISISLQDNNCSENMVFNHLYWCASFLTIITIRHYNFLVLWKY